MSVHKRQEALELMAEFVLAEGLTAASLRPLAIAAGTSDRMLLYYFKNKDELLTATLGHIAERMTALLDEAIPAGKQLRFDRLLREVWRVLSSENLKQFMPLWLELAAGSSRGLEPHRRIAGEIADGYLAWIAKHLWPSSEQERTLEAARFMIMIEGMYLLHAVGRPQIADQVRQHSVKQA